MSVHVALQWECLLIWPSWTRYRQVRGLPQWAEFVYSVWQTRSLYGVNVCRLHLKVCEFTCQNRWGILGCWTNRIQSYLWSTEGIWSHHNTVIWKISATCWTRFPVQMWNCLQIENIWDCMRTYAFSVATKQKQSPSRLRKFLCLKPGISLSQTFYTETEEKKQWKPDLLLQKQERKRWALKGMMNHWQ